MRALTESAEVQAEAPFRIDVLESLLEDFYVAYRVEHDVQYNRQADEAGDADPRGVQQIRQRHELSTLHNHTATVNKPN